MIIQEEGTKEETIPEATEVKKKKKRKINDDFVEKVDDTDEQNVKKIKLESKVEDRGPVESERSDSSSTGRKRKNKNSYFTDIIYIYITRFLFLQDENIIIIEIINNQFL